MQLDCYKIYPFAPDLVPGSARRRWMDEFQDRHPYRCLPLTMANSTGWEIRTPIDVTIEWDGGPLEENLKLYTRSDPRALKAFADSHFRKGIVTFHTGYLFRTPPGWGVWATGAPNLHKHGISPLTGLVETDWLPFPFTMNWQMTKAGRVSFQKDEPFCFITLMEHARLEEVQPRVSQLDDHPELKREYAAWRDSRTDFNKRLGDREQKAMRDRWQRHYMRGETATGAEGGADHVTKRRLKPPVAD